MVSYFWDFLRPFTEMAHQFDMPLTWLVFLFSIALLGIAILAYRKNKSRKLLFVFFAFFFFAAKWLLKVFDLYLSPGNFLSDPSENVFELLIFVSLFLALFKK